MCDRENTNIFIVLAAKQERDAEREVLAVFVATLGHVAVPTLHQNAVHHRFEREAEGLVATRDDALLADDGVDRLLSELCFAVGGMDGMLHIDDSAWKKGSTPRRSC